MRGKLPKPGDGHDNNNSNNQNKNNNENWFPSLLALVRERRLRDAAVGSKTSSIENSLGFMMDSFWFLCACTWDSSGMKASMGAKPSRRHR